MSDDERAQLEAARINERALDNWRHEADASARVSSLYCLDCGNTIPEQRRQAVPGVTLCLACKQAEELHARLHCGL